ncbi:MAG: glucosamine-6-phosphate deaminase [Oscillospiraceae bacterium]
MRIIRAKDYEDMSKKAAIILGAQVAMKPDSVLGLATGSSPVGMYQQLIAWNQAGDLDFSQVKSVNLDEYFGLTAQNDQSYAYFMYHNLFKGINIDLKNTHLPDGTNPDIAAECARYDAVIDSMGGVDLQVLGIGGNGHIAFNEPADCFKMGTHCVTLTQKTIEANARFFERIEDVPTKAYTMGVGSIMKAKKILMVVNGEAKAQAMLDSFFGDITPQVQASILQMHNDCVVVADEAALKLVDEKFPGAVK